MSSAAPKNHAPNTSGSVICIIHCFVVLPQYDPAGDRLRSIDWPRP